MITYAQLLVAFRAEPDDGSEIVGRWVKRFEDVDRVRFGDWFPLGVTDDAGEIQRLVTFVSTDVVADTQWVALDPVRPAHRHQLPMSGFLGALWKTDWVELDRFPVDGSATRL